MLGNRLSNLLHVVHWGYAKVEHGRVYYISVIIVAHFLAHLWFLNQVWMLVFLNRLACVVNQLVRRYLLGDESRALLVLARLRSGGHVFVLLGHSEVSMIHLLQRCRSVVEILQLLSIPVVVPLFGLRVQGVGRVDFFGLGGTGVLDWPEVCLVVLAAVSKPLLAFDVAHGVLSEKFVDVLCTLSWVVALLAVDLSLT